MKRAEVAFKDGVPSFRVVSVPMPETPKTGARLKTSFCGICGGDASDSVSSIDGMVMGHEISGIIEEFGSEAEAEKYGLEVGDSVILYPFVSCGGCEACAVGKTNECMKGFLSNAYGMGPIHPGGYSTHVLAHHLDILVKIPDSISREVACMFPCGGVTAYTSLKKAQPYLEAGAARNGAGRLLVAGPGGLGLWAIQLAKLLFSDFKVEITAAHIKQEKLNTAKEYGADFSVLWKTHPEDYLDEAQKITRGGEYKFDAVIDFVGLSDTFNVSYRCLRFGGTVISVGVSGEYKVELDMNEVVFGNLHIQGNLVGTLEEVKEMVEFLKDKNIHYPAVEHTSLDNIADTMARLENRKIHGRALIKF